MLRAVFLDRDGVINTCTVRGGTPYPPGSVDALCVEPGTAEAMAALKEAGFLLLVVTNQPDVARGTQRREIVEAINAKLRAALPIDDIAVCYHDNADGCECRKPRPGMLLSLGKKWGVDFGHSFMVGDRSGDIVAGAAAGVTTLLVDRPYSKGDQCDPDHRVRDLSHAARIILGMRSEDGR